ncbi:MAG: mechanosensitive ion channel [Puniceicoccales bacterium]|jgi:small conductance mechanosensitive channel|nr:mechanosensitive ion channel [Puniceicoccales bacterium]
MTLPDSIRTLSAKLNVLFTQSAPDALERIVIALVILAAGHWVAKRLCKLAQLALERTRMDATLLKFLVRVLHGFLAVVVVLAALEKLGVQTTSLVAIIGAVGLAVGLALQGSLSNFAAGVMLVVFRSFKVDDAISVSGIAGTVEEIGLFAVSLRTGDNRLVLVPNSTFIGQVVTNDTAKHLRRIDLTIGIGYGDNIKSAREIIQRTLAEDPRVLDSPAATIAVANLGENSVDLVVRPWVATADYWAARFALLENLKIALETGGCTIPYPQRDLHIIQSSSGK